MGEYAKIQNKSELHALFCVFFFNRKYNKAVPSEEGTASLYCVLWLI